MKTLDFNIAGIRHRASDFTTAHVQKGDSLKLVPEPTNAYDRNAIMVCKGARHIGYVPRSDTRFLAEAVSQGKYRCSVLNAWGMGCSAHVEWAIEPSEEDMLYLKTRLEQPTVRPSPGIGIKFVRVDLKDGLKFHFSYEDGCGLSIALSPDGTWSYAVSQ